jgi:hypothetical protein
MSTGLRRNPRQGLSIASGQLRYDEAASVARVSDTLKPYNPMTSIKWIKSAWADDPYWLNPGDGNAVSAWRIDGSVAGDFAVPSGTITYRQTGFNGRGCVEFTTTSQLRTPDFAVAQPFTTIWIGKRNGAGGAGNEGILELSKGVSPFTTFFMRTSSGKFSTYAGTFADSTISYDTSNHSSRAFFNGASSRLVIDSTITNISPGTAGIAALWLNGYGGAGERGNSSFAFVGVYKGDITLDPQWNDFKAWILYYYGIILA